MTTNQTRGLELVGHCRLAFDISITMDSAAAHTIANPGRAFRIVQIQAYNAGGTPNLTVTNGSANILNAATVATATNAWKNMPLDEANCNLTAAQNIVVTNLNPSRKPKY